MTSALVGISLKMYTSAAQTTDWVASLRAEVGARTGSGDIEVSLLPSFPLLEPTANSVRDSAIRWRAQHLAADPDSAQAGEVDDAILRELGCWRSGTRSAEAR